MGATLPFIGQVTVGVVPIVKWQTKGKVALIHLLRCIVGLPRGRTLTTGLGVFDRFFKVQFPVNVKKLLSALAYQSQRLDEACTSVMTRVISLGTSPISSATLVCRVPGACLQAHSWG